MELNQIWDETSNKSDKKVIKRLFANFEPLVIVDNILYLKYIGDKDKKAIVSKFLKINFSEFEQLIKNSFNVSGINFKKISDLKLEWLKNLIKEFGPSEVKISILDN